MKGKSSVHEQASLLGDAVFAASDGLVTTFAIVAGSTGASLSPRVILILGFANLFADGISMASANYLGEKSEMEYEEARGDHSQDVGSPIRHGLMTFTAFSIAGFLPLIPFVFNAPFKVETSIVVVGLSLAFIGYMRGRYTNRSYIKSGVEMLVVGGFAATTAYLVGFVLDKFVSINI